MILSAYAFEVGRTTKQCWFVCCFTSLRICVVSDDWLPHNSDDSKDIDEKFQIFAWGEGDQELPRELHVPYWKWKCEHNSDVVVTPLLQKVEDKLHEYEQELRWPSPMQ